jgi:transposase
MIDMDQYEYIRTAQRVYGKGIRQIMRETGHDRKTIRKVLSGEYCGYSKREKQPYPALGEFLEVIDGWLEEDKKAQRKQRHTAARIYRRLVNEHGFAGSESTVRQYVRHAKVRLGVEVGRAFIPLEPDCGKEAEVDWGGADAVIGGEVIRLKFFCMRSKYSGKHFIRFYPCERQQAFFDGHMRGFDFFGGVFATIVYDNLSAAVQKVLRGKERVEQEAFRRMHGYYNFMPRFCNVASGHEKGGVEGLVGFARRNYMVPVPEAESLEDLNERVLKECVAYGDHRLPDREGRTVDELFEEERSHLIALPAHGFTNTLEVGGKVNPYSTVILDRNRYSVPCSYVGLRVRAVLGVERIAIFYGSKLIASHERVFSNGKWQLDPDHYLDLLERRPGAFDSARPIRQWRRSWPKALEDLLGRFVEKRGQADGIKDFICVLKLYREHRREDVDKAVEQALEKDILSGAGIKQMVLHSQSKEDVCALEGWVCTQQPDVSVYGELGGVS